MRKAANSTKKPAFEPLFLLEGRGEQKAFCKK